MSGDSRVAIQKPMNRALNGRRRAAVQHNHVDLGPVSRRGIWAFDKTLDRWFHLSRSGPEIAPAFNPRMTQAAEHEDHRSEAFFQESVAINIHFVFFFRRFDDSPMDLRRSRFIPS